MQPLVSLVIAEAALETVPKEIADHPSVRKQAQRLGKKPTEILLDRSFHHSAMINKKIESDWKRGRPDIVHFALMEALSTPLFLNGLLKVYVHTFGNKLIDISGNLRIPKSYHRFEGLMMTLFKDKIIKSDEGDVLLKLYDNVTFKDLVSLTIKPDLLLGFSSMGLRSTLEEVVQKNVGMNTHAAFVIGGFPKGHFSSSTGRLFNNSYSIEKVGLEGHVVIARLIYECEKVLQKKFNEEMHPP